MAEFNSALYDEQVGSSGQVSPAGSYPLAKNAAGKLRILKVPYTVIGTEASGDTINLGKLKPGAVVIPSLSRVLSGAGFDVSDMDIGVASNPNAYADAMDTTDVELDQPFTGGDNRFEPADTAVGDEAIIATLTTVVTSTAASVALFLIAYVDE